MIVQIGKTFKYSAQDINTTQKLPVGTYLLKYNSNDDEYYYEQKPDFDVPTKVYGDSIDIAKRYLNTFTNSNGNTGVLLTGKKGTGKSLTAKMVCKLSNLPVILITEDFRGDTFKSFLTNLEQEVIVFIDEFEKVYDEEHTQNEFLSLLDGVFMGKKLYLFTSNNIDRINRYMLNRPGRIHYLREYDSLDQHIVNDVIADNLTNKDYRTELTDVIDLLGGVTMDVLLAIIAEVNMYNESPRVAVKHLNIKPESQNYELKLYIKDKLITSEYTSYHPLSNEKLYFEYQTDGDYDYVNIDLKDATVTTKNKTIEIKKDNIKIVCTPSSTYKFAF